MKTTYIAELPLNTQSQIKEELLTMFKEIDFTPEEIKSNISDAMNSRLCDLEDTIKINKYL